MNEEARITWLEAENARLRTLRDDLCVALSGPGGLRFEDMPERAKLLRQNSERYEWLRANTEWMYPSSEGSDQKHAYLTVTGYGDCFHDPKAGEIVDAAIDAAMKA